MQVDTSPFCNLERQFKLFVLNCVQVACGDKNCTKDLMSSIASLDIFIISFCRSGLSRNNKIQCLFVPRTDSANKKYHIF